MEYGSEYDWAANSNFLGGHGLGIDGARYYRSGRDAMKALARMGESRPSVVLLPALCCESMIVPFSLNGCPVVFYKLNPDLTGDQEDVLKKLRDGAMLLYMNYFGIKPFTELFLKDLKTRYNNLILAEDRTHDLLIPREEGFEPDVMVASVRKWAALPDGGILCSNYPCEPGREDRRFSTLRRKAMERKSLYLADGDPELKKTFLRELKDAAEMLDEDGAPIAMTPEYRSLIDQMDFEKILRHRQHNALLLKSLLEPLLSSGKLKLLTERPENSTLYFPILVYDQERVQSAMARHDIYCPSIWPVPEEARDVCSVSQSIGEHMLAIPCDQRYDDSDMEYIATTLKHILT